MITEFIDIKNFDLDKFIDNIIEFLPSTLIGENPAINTISCVESATLKPLYDVCAKATYEYELEVGNCLFFPFTSNEENNIIHCADNTNYDTTYSGSCFAETDCLGFLVQQENNTLIFFSATYVVDNEDEPDIVWKTDCVLFDDAMSEYLKTFIIE